MATILLRKRQLHAEAWLECTMTSIHKSRGFQRIVRARSPTACRCQPVEGSIQLLSSNKHSGPRNSYIRTAPLIAADHPSSSGIGETVASKSSFHFRCAITIIAEGDTSDTKPSLAHCSRHSRGWVSCLPRIIRPETTCCPLPCRSAAVVTPTEAVAETTSVQARQASSSETAETAMCSARCDRQMSSVIDTAARSWHQLVSHRL